MLDSYRVMHYKTGLLPASGAVMIVVIFLLAIKFLLGYKCRLVLA